MKRYLHALFPAVFFKSPVYFRAMVLGIIYLGVLLAQLFTYEDFLSVIKGLELPGGDAIAQAVVWVSPLVLIIALPFLISMHLTTRSYRLTRGAVIAAPVLWLLIASWLVATGSSANNTGLFGATIPTPAGWWLVGFTLLWLGAAVFVIRELPRRHR